MLHVDYTAKAALLLWHVIAIVRLGIFPLFRARLSFDGFGEQHP